MRKDTIFVSREHKTIIDKLSDNDLVEYDSRDDFNDVVKCLKALKKYNVLAYKDYFDKALRLHRNRDEEKIAELKLKSDKLFNFVYGEPRVIYSIKNKKIHIHSIEPKEILIEMHQKQLTSYKGCILLSPKYKSKIDFYIRLNGAMNERDN